MSTPDDSPDPDNLPPAVRETLDRLGRALGDIADLDDEQFHETTSLLQTLGHEKAAELLVSRRDLMKATGIAATGAAVGGAGVYGMTGRAEAQAAGTIGDGNEDWDVNSLTAGSVDTEELWNNVTAISQHADSGSGTSADPFTSASGTGGFEEAMNFISDEGGIIVWDGWSEFTSSITVPETQYNLFVEGAHIGGGQLADSFSAPQLFDININGIGANPTGGDGMLHVFQNLTFYGNKANVTSNTTCFVDTQTTDRICKSWFNNLLIDQFPNRGFEFEGNINRINNCEITMCGGAGILWDSGDIRAVDTTIDRCGKDTPEAGLIFSSSSSSCKFIGGEVTLCDEDTSSGNQVEMQSGAEGNIVIASKLQARPSQTQYRPYSVGFGDQNSLVNVFGQNAQPVQDFNPDSETAVAGDNTATGLVQKALGGYLVVVYGEDQGSSTSFTDIVLWQLFGGVTSVIDSANNGTPGGRTYTVNGSVLSVAINDSGVTYDVTVHVL